MIIHVYPSEEELIYAIAEYFIEAANYYIKASKHFNVVLSGGKSPAKLYELLAQEYNSVTDWSKINFFFGDERYVPLNDTDSNYAMVNTKLFQPLSIPKKNIFEVNTSLEPADCATDYMNRINIHFKNKPPVFDLILLGLGDNAHTASLFPNERVLNEKSATIKSFFLATENRYRITMTAPLINLANRIAFLVYGASKAKAVSHVLSTEDDEQIYPARLINPLNGTCTWFLDVAATSLSPTAL